ncbi:MAG TPA: class I SAM-dependent methyltransferase [Dehalococcoidia bacterium]|nr:class I SAM-dependent methyltransferase [Dehalococcoidia bacterium]
MTTKTFYEIEAVEKETGAAIDGRARRALRLFRRHAPAARRLLDIGCGVGAIGRYLQDGLGTEELFGVEISERRVEAARARGLQACLADVNSEPLPFADGSFDAVFCGEVIEHLTDTDHLLDQIGRVLAPEGVCVLTTPNLAMWPNRLALAAGWQPFDTSVSLRHEVGRPKLLVSDWGCRGHLQVFTPRALRELLTAHGFRVLAVSGVPISEVYVGSVDWRRKPVRSLLLTLLEPLDRLLSLRPSLACRIVVAFDRPPGGAQSRTGSR